MNCGSRILTPVVKGILFVSRLVVYRTSSPFSCKDFNLGSGGTFPTQALMRCPPTLSVQLLQSPFLQLYRGLIPRPEAAFFMGLPARKFFFFPLWVNTVISKGAVRW